MNWLPILAIAVANNLDNTGVGIAYGLAQIKLRPLVNLWIAVITFVITGAAGLMGHQAAHLLAPAIARGLSALILCSAGLFVLFPSLTRKSSRGRTETDGLPALPDMPHPTAARSEIELREIRFGAGTLLGIALSINNVAGGFSAGLVHLSVIGIALSSAALSYLVLWFGIWAGERLGTPRLGHYTQFAAGILLVVIGLYQLV